MPLLKSLQQKLQPLFTDIPEKIGQFIEDRPGSFLDVATRIPEEFKKTPIAGAIRSIFPKPATQQEELQNLALNFTPTGIGRVSKVVKPSVQPIVQPIFKGFKDLTTKFLDYAKGKTTLSKQEITDFARRPELKKGEADLLNRLGSEVKETKFPAQEFADSIRRDLLELKPTKVKEPQYRSTSINRGLEESMGLKDISKNYEEVVFESPIVTNGSTHYPNSKNYFAHARGDEVIEGGKRVWREQEIQSDLLQKDRLESSLERAERDIKIADIAPSSFLLNQERVKASRSLVSGGDKLQPFTNDRFGERIMRERIKAKAQQGYEKYRLPTGETIGKIEGFDTTPVWSFERASGNLWNAPRATTEELKIGKNIVDSRSGSDWIITDILGDGRFKAVNPNNMNKVPVLKATKENPQFSINYKGEKLYSYESLKETFDLTGKSNPQYRRYEDWGKFLRNKFGGKQVTDPQGNSWMEIDLTSALKKAPIEAFGIGLFPFTRQKEQEEPLFTSVR